MKKYNLIKLSRGNRYAVSENGVGIDSRTAERMLVFVNGRIERRFLSVEHLKAAVRAYVTEVTGGKVNLEEAYITIPAYEVSNRGWSWEIRTVVAKVAIRHGRMYLESAYTDDARTARRSATLSQYDVEKIMRRRFNAIIDFGEGVEK